MKPKGFVQQLANAIDVKQKKFIPQINKAGADLRGMVSSILNSAGAFGAQSRAQRGSRPVARLKSGGILLSDGTVKSPARGGAVLGAVVRPQPQMNVVRPSSAFQKAPETTQEAVMQDFLQSFAPKQREMPKGISPQRNPILGGIHREGLAKPPGSELKKGVGDVLQQATQNPQFRRFLMQFGGMNGQRGPVPVRKATRPNNYMVPVRGMQSKRVGPRTDAYRDLVASILKEED